VKRPTVFRQPSTTPLKRRIEMATKNKQQKVVLTLPEMGLKPAQMTSLKKRFKNELVESMGGVEALARRRIVIIIIIVYI
jgi:ABC-type antimicrobial peptide transport system ATPase subunit